MRSSIRRAITGAAIAVASTASAQQPLLLPFLADPETVANVGYPDLPGWWFFRTGSYCYAARQNDDGRLVIGYNRARGEVHVGFTAQELAPVPDGTQTTVDIVMVDMDAKGRMAGQRHYWDPLPVTVLVGPAGERVYNFKLDGREAIISFSRHAAVAFSRGDELLQAFKLDRSTAALKRLATCDPR